MILQFHPQFREDVEQVASYYDARQDGLGIKLITEIIRSVTKIQDFPEAYRVLHRDVRRCRIGVFKSYGILYRFLHKEGVIRILSLKHDAQNQDFGHERK